MDDRHVPVVLELYNFALVVGCQNRRIRESIRRHLAFPASCLGCQDSAGDSLSRSLFSPDSESGGLPVPHFPNPVIQSMDLNRIFCRHYPKNIKDFRNS